MIDQLKGLALQQLSNVFASNSLGENDTKAAASEGANELANLFSSGNLSQITSLFSNDGNPSEQNPIFQNLQGKLMGILQNKGMNQEEARQEANNAAPQLINSLKDRFMSDKPEDSGFDLSSIAGLIGGEKIGGAMDTLKKFF